MLQSITNRKLQHAHSASDGHHMTGTEGASCHGGGADVGSFHSLPAASQPQVRDQVICVFFFMRSCVIS